MTRASDLANILKQPFTNTLGTSNYRAGVNTGDSIASGGNYNVVVGDEAGTALTTGDNNVAIGFEALSTEDGHGFNVAVGHQALKTLNAGQEGYHTAVGYLAGTSMTTAFANTVMGGLAGDALTDGNNNTAVGVLALSADTRGSKSVALGYGTLEYQNFTSATDVYNTAVGFSAGNAVTTGVQSVYIGGLAGDADTTGGKNTYVGYNSGTANAGDQNVFIGHSAGSAITNGDKNTIIGKYDGNSGGLDIRTADNTIVLSDGDGNPRVIVNSGGSMVVGSVDHSPFQSSEGHIVALNDGTRYGGLFGCDNIANRDAIAFVNPNGFVGSIKTNGSSTSYNTSSDHRLKENVQDMTGAIDRVKQLLPKRFNFKTDADTTVDGFLAHEAQTIIPEAVHGEKDAVDDNGDAVMQGIDQSKLVPLLTGALKEAIAKIEALETRVATLEGA